MMDLFIQSSSFLLQNMLIDGIDGRVDYCHVFISCLNSHSDGTGSIGEQVM